MVAMAMPPKKLSLSLENAPLTDALLFIAGALHLNLVLSPAISGNTNLHFIDAEPKNAFYLLLQMHGLGQLRSGNIIYVAPNAELIKKQEEQTKLLPPTFNMLRLRYAKAEEIAKIINSPANSFLSTNAILRIDKRTNMLLIKDTQLALIKIKKIVRQLDIPTPQIMITVRLVSINKDSEQELGLQFSQPERMTTQNEMMQSTGNLHLALFKLARSSLLDIKLAALENAGRAKLISSPRLFTANQQSASIEAGEEVPYQEVSESGGTAISFKRAVLGLQVTPQLLPDNKVLLQLKINQDRPSAKLIQGVPTINTRQIKTQVVVPASQTLILGGFYEENKEQVLQGIPYISHIPVVGWLFKQQQIRLVKRELLIFVTPTVIN